jgi:long-subunit acyl-CoA synthetase (AMP-forming)
MSMTTTTTQRLLPLERFLHWEKAQADKVYLTQPFPDGRVVDYTWAQVGDQARRMASHLLSLDLPPASHIAILGKNSAHWLMADLAIWMAGHVSVPIYPTMSGDTVRQVLEHSESRLLFLGKLDGVSDNWHGIRAALPPSLPQIALPLFAGDAPRADLPQWDDLAATHEPLAQPRFAAPDALATIIYTSGSTGAPKGVMHSQLSAAGACAAMLDTFGLTPDDRMISYLPLAHAAERAAVELHSLCNGFHVYFSDSLATFADDLRRARPTFFFSVPRLWTKFHQAVEAKLPDKKLKRLLKIPLVASLVRKKILRQLGLDHCRIAVTGSAPLPPELVAWYRNLGLEMLDGYGMTENFAASHFSRVGQVRIGYVGSPVLGVSARISETPDNAGELEVKSPAQMLGYYKQPDETASILTADGYLKTGDRGEVDAQQRLKITGRVKELFKTSKGKYVAPAPIENLLGRHVALDAICVTGSGFAQPIALATLAPEVQARLAEKGFRDSLTRELGELLVSVNAELEHHERLDCLVLVQDDWSVENGLLTPTLKIRRNRIEDSYLPAAPTWLDRRQPVVWAN